MRQYAKGNKNNTGMLTTVAFNSKEEAVFISLIRQTGWSAEHNRPTFGGGERIVIKINPIEVAGIITAIEKRDAFSFFHSFDGAAGTNGSLKYMEQQKDDGSTRCGFGLYMKKDGKDYKTSFTVAEATEMSFFLRFSLDHIYSAIYSAAKQQAEEFKKKQAAQKPAPTAPAAPKNDTGDIDL
jgi:hypothetical protein